MYRLKTKNLLIFYNIITMFKYIIAARDILFIDFQVDFIFFNIMIFSMCITFNYMSKFMAYDDDEILD